MASEQQSEQILLAPEDEQRLLTVLRDCWGHSGFRPLQAEAMACVLSGRDSMVVLPTGGGKSICYQAPALCLDGMAVVVSPLISLMKDQVDGLRQLGVNAACINSSLSPQERRQVADDVQNGLTQLLYIAPERLVMERTLEFLKSVPISMIAIDEAHCISEWGHDFRPEYRTLALLKEHFPNVGVHAYTATATQRVRGDIASQLALDSPHQVVGSFDRPNLTYRVQRRNELMNQICAVLERHPRESGIIYCISRADVDRTCAKLNQLGFRARPYHAGLDDEDRKRNQEAFIEDRIELIVATVAFGMGIDKSDVRFVIHAGMPKSVENYQQESGRAGRDGLEAECCLFYSGGDFRRWQTMIEDQEESVRQTGMNSLSAIYNFCTGTVCRHEALVNHFGQHLDGSCQACDVCLGEIELVADGLVLAQKILSCVVRLKQRYGAEYTARVLCGSREQRILDAGHDELTTWGLLADEQQRNVRDWIEQLAAQGFVEKVGEYNTLSVTPTGWRLLREGVGEPRLSQRRKAAGRKERDTQPASWEGVDRELFDELKALRTELAREQGVPPYVVFNDASLRDMARQIPRSPAEFLEVHGVGNKKAETYGAVFLEKIEEFLAGESDGTDP